MGSQEQGEEAPGCSVFILETQGNDQLQETDFLIFSYGESDSSLFTQHSGTTLASIRRTLVPTENKLQTKEQTLVQELGPEEMFRLYLQVFMKLGPLSSAEGLEGSTIHIINSCVRRVCLPSLRPWSRNCSCL